VIAEKKKLRFREAFGESAVSGAVIYRGKTYDAFL